MKRRTATALAVATAGAVATVALTRRRHADDAPLAVLEGGESAKVTTSDGAVLEAHVAGAGPTVVLTHCWTGNMDVWAPVAADLVDRGFRVVRYHARGHGASTMGTADVDIHRLGADLHDVITTLDVRDAVLAGHSMGGMTAQAFVIDHPEVANERLKALVLVATSSGELGTNPLAASAVRLVGRPELDRLLAGRVGNRVVRGSHGARPHRAAVVATRDAFVATPGPVRRRLLQAMLDMDLIEGTRSITLPTTIVAGTRDGLTPIRMSRAMARTIPDARLVEVPRAGHMLPLEATQLVADLIAEAHA